MQNLETVEIGESSFMRDEFLHDWLERAFYLVDCPRVTELTIGEWSLRDYSHFIIKNCSSLRSIITDYASVEASNRIEFEDLPELVSMKLGYWTFAAVYSDDDESNTLIMKNLPKLASVKTAYYGSAFMGAAFYYIHSVVLESKSIVFS
ncbi:hypothetical protein BLSTO_06052 [Blastocystis sp. subtype 1]